MPVNRHHMVGNRRCANIVCVPLLCCLPKPMVNCHRVGGQRMNAVSGMMLEGRLSMTFGEV